jgi:hypothetical protein
MGGLLFVAVAGFAGAFTHMHDWTARYETRDWMCWVNAIISEIMPTVSFLVWRDREEQERSTAMPLIVFLGSTGVSICAQLSSTGKHFPHEQDFLAVLPLLALMALAKLVLGDLKYAKDARLAKEAEATRRAEVARNQAEQRAELAARRTELAAELARNQAAELARRETELAAELARNQADHEAELARQAAERDAAERRRLAEIEQAGMTRREQLAVAERAEVRRVEQERQRRQDEAAAAVQAEASRIEAEARAGRERAETARIEAETRAKEQAIALLAARPTAPDGVRERPSDTVGRHRLTREERAVQVEALLLLLPAGTTRPEAVVQIAEQLSVSTKYVREFVPDGWVAAGSDAGSVGRPSLSVVGAA